MNAEMMDFKKRVMNHTDAIWVREPLDIYFLKKGYAPSGAGINNQYFTTTVMLSGEIRALGIHIFPELLKFSKSGHFTLEQIKEMLYSMLKVDCGVVAYFGLREYGHFLEEFRELSQKIEDLDTMVDLLGEMFTLTNRYQLWLHQIFPWYLSVHFKKADLSATEAFAAKMRQEESNHG